MVNIGFSGSGRARARAMGLDAHVLHQLYVLYYADGAEIRVRTDGEPERVFSDFDDVPEHVCLGGALDVPAASADGLTSPSLFSPAVPAEAAAASPPSPPPVPVRVVRPSRGRGRRS